MPKSPCASVDEARQRVTDPRYTIEEFIGEGGMACVYLAREKGTPNRYALKLLRERYRAKAAFIEFFQREAGNMRDLQYPNIVRYYKFAVEDSSAYILMDYVDGEPLSKVLQQYTDANQFYPLNELVRILVQIARAINYLHTEGFIHRDIKPGNVLLQREDQKAFLTDLGITGTFEGQEELLGAGTPSYMPYEQQTNEPIDYTVDIYAFAVMLFEVFTGEKPFQVTERGQAARDAMIEKHRSAPIPSISEKRPDLPPKMDAIFKQALAKDPDDRYQDVMVFAQDIHRALRPQLNADLQQFTTIQARQNTLDDTAPPASANAATSTTDSSALIIVSIAAVLMLTGIVLAGFAFNWTNQQGDSTATASDVVAVVTDEPTPSPPPTTIPTLTPTRTATPPPTATPFFFDTTPVILATGAETIGLPDSLSLNDALYYALGAVREFVPLRLSDDSNSFYVTMTLQNTDALDSYGIAFRVQDADNYVRFRIDTTTNQWLIEQIVDGDIRPLASDDLTSQPRTLSVTGDDQYVRLRYDDTNIQQTINRWDSGYAALWFDALPSTQPTLEQVELGSISEASSELHAPRLTPLGLLIDDVDALRETGTSSGIVDCAEHIPIYESLARYTTPAPIADAASQVQQISALIYNRCTVESPDSSLDFGDAFTDYLDWETDLETLLSELESRQ